MTQPRTLRIYETHDGRRPFQEWIDSLEDSGTRGRILVRMDRIGLGLMGDFKGVGEGVYEVRLDFGPGFRVYLAPDGKSVVILLCGGDKATQRKDIVAAKSYWTDYRTRKDAEKRKLR